MNVFPEFCFEFVKNLFNVPAVLVEQNVDPCREGQFIGQVAVFHAIGGIDVNDLAEFVALGGFDQSVLDDAFVEMGAVVDDIVFAYESGGAIALFQCAEIDSFLRLGLHPEGIVDAGGVSDVEKFLPFPNSGPQAPEILAF